MCQSKEHESEMYAICESGKDALRKVKQRCYEDATPDHHLKNQIPAEFEIPLPLYDDACKMIWKLSSESLVM